MKLPRPMLKAPWSRARRLTCAAVASATALGGVAVAMPLQANAASATGAPYVVGAISTLTGPLSGDFGGIPRVLEAWQKWTNAHGGIGGHPVEVVSKDDQGSPSIGLQDAKQLVEENHAIAFLTVSDTAPTWGPWVTSQNIPIIGGSPSLAPPDEPLYFMTGGAVVTQVYGAAHAASKQGKKNIGIVYCAEAAVCAKSVPLLTQVAKQNKMKMVYAASAAEDSQSYTSYCLAARQKGADALDFGLSGTSIVTAAKDCEQQGFNPLVTLIGPQAGPLLAKGMPTSSTSVVSQPTFPWFVHSTTATKEYYQALKKYDPKIFKSLDYNPGASQAWVAGKMFEAAAQHLGSDPSASGVLDGLYSLHDETLGGLIGPTTYTKGQVYESPSYFIIKLHNGKYTAPYGMKVFTAPAS